MAGARPWGSPKTQCDFKVAQKTNRPLLIHQQEHWIWMHWALLRAIGQRKQRNKRWCFGTYWPSSFKALWSVVAGGCSQGHWSSSDIKESPARLMLSLPCTLCRLNHPARREKFIQEWIKFISDGFTPSGEGQHIVFHTQPAMSCCWKMTAA